MKQANELYSKIAEYPGDTWKESPEFLELMKTLRDNDIESLKEKGYAIPSWKTKQ